MTKCTFIFVLSCLFAAKVLAAESSYEITIPYASVLEMQQNVTEALKKAVSDSVTASLANIKNFDAYLRDITDSTLAKHQKYLQERVEKFKQEIYQQKNRSSDSEDIVVDCLIEEGQMDVLMDDITQEVKACAGTVMVEATNVISDSINQAQTFMTIPETIGKDFEKCDDAAICIQVLLTDSISEAIQVPPKVFTLSARIQQITLRTVVSIDSCALRGLERITKTAMSIIEEILCCISDKLQE